MLQRRIYFNKSYCKTKQSVKIIEIEVLAMLSNEKRRINFPASTNQSHA